MIILLLVCKEFEIQQLISKVIGYQLERNSMIQYITD